MKRMGRKINWMKAARLAALLMAAGIGCTQTGCGNRNAQESLMKDKDVGIRGQEDEGEQKEEKNAEYGITGEKAGEKAEKESEKTGESVQKRQEGTERSAEGGRKVPAGSLELVPAELLVCERKTGEDTAVSIGSLEIVLPFGWEMETRVSGEGVEQHVLVDVHSQCEGGEIEGHKDGYEHEIVITPYEINRMPELNRQLAAEMRAYFSVPEFYGTRGVTKTAEIDGCWMYGENSHTYEKEYFLFSENEAGGMELFHVREGDTWITSSGNDLEAFREFMDEGLVWTNGGKYPVHRYPKREMESYYLLNENTGNPLLMVVWNYTDKISVYQTSDYQTEICTQKLEGDFFSEYMGIADLNQDGYEDIICKRWMLDTESALDFSAADDFDGYFWDAGNSEFVYVEGAQMLEQSGSFWEEMRKAQEERQKDGGGQIPEDLAAYVAEYLLKDREELQNAMLALVSDRELAMEEVKELAEENEDIKKEMLAIAANHSGTGIWLNVDADNDGIGDVFLCQYLGGTLGPVTYYLFTGTEDGHYKLTDRKESLKEEFGFIQWEGKNYLAKTTWEFTKKCVDGISIECYENGRYQGGIWLSITAKEGKNARSIKTFYIADEKFQGLAAGLEDFSRTYEIGSRVPYGTAEEEKENSDYQRSCDIDNDGAADEYNVSLWQTTNYYTVDYLTFESEEELRTRIYDMINGDETAGIPLNLWVDKTEYGNVIYVLYEDGLYDFHICGYMLSEGCEKLVQVDCQTQTEVTVQRIEK